MNQVSGKIENSKKVSLIGVVLGICMIAVILIAYGQISILQKNTNDLQSNNSSLSNQVAALKANLQQQVASQEANVSSLTHAVADLQAQITALKSQLSQIGGNKTHLNSHIALLKAKAFEFVNTTVASILIVSCVPN